MRAHAGDNERPRLKFSVEVKLQTLGRRICLDAMDVSSAGHADA